MTSVTINEAKKQLSQLIDRAERGEEVIITRDNKPIAHLVAYLQGRPRARLWLDEGKAWLDESFWEPLPEEELKLWEGG